MREWFDRLVEKGPMFGYFPKPSKCILLSKPDRVELAHQAFKGSGIDIQTEGAKDSGVEIITNGTRHLGAAVGTDEAKLPATPLLFQPLELELHLSTVT